MESSIGQRLRAIREWRGISQSELSRRTGIGQPTISIIETGAQRGVHTATLERLAAALDIPVGAFFGEDLPQGPPTPPKTPKTDEPAEEFDKRFAATGAAEAEELREELGAEFSELEAYTKGLRAAGVGDDNLTLRRAGAKLQLAKERLFAVQLRQGDLDVVAGREAQPKPSVADYIPSAEQTEELLKMLLGEEREAEAG